MQLGTADCGTWSFAFLAAGKKQTAIHTGYLLHVVIPSAFRAARKMQVDSFVSVLSDRKPKWFPSVTYLHSATVTKCFWELWIVGHGHLHFKRLAKSRWQFITVMSCIWSFHLHFEPLAKCKWILLRAVLSDRKLNGFSSVTYLHSAAFTKCCWELRIVGHGRLHFQLLAKNRRPFITVISCMWLFHLHLEPPAKFKWILLCQSFQIGKPIGFLQ